MLLASGDRANSGARLGGSVVHERAATPSVLVSSMSSVTTSPGTSCAPLAGTLNKGSSKARQQPALKMELSNDNSGTSIRNALSLQE